MVTDGKTRKLCSRRQDIYIREVRNENMLAEGKEKDNKISENFEKGNRWTSPHLM